MLRNILIFALLTAVSPALAEKRVALVIGNSLYQSVPALQNPVNDATAMASMFSSAGFDVVEAQRNLGNVEMRRVLRDFTDKTVDADIAIIYYAGHGIEVDGSNYLIPVDVSLQRDTDVYDEAISLDRILQALEPAKQLRLVILDACRDNPFRRTIKRTLASRSIGRGLAGVEPSRPNTLVAFAAKGGSTAADGDKNHSPFTTALLKHLVEPGIEIRKALGLVRDDVMRSTGNKQEPFVYGSLGGIDVALVPKTSAPPVVSSNDIRRDYELAAQVGTSGAWASFLSLYPTGFYADLANAQRNKLLVEEAQSSAVKKAPETEIDQSRLALRAPHEAGQREVLEQARPDANDLASTKKGGAEASANIAAVDSEKTEMNVKTQEDAAPSADKTASNRANCEDGYKGAEERPGSSTVDCQRAVQVKQPSATIKGVGSAKSHKRSVAPSVSAKLIKKRPLVDLTQNEGFTPHKRCPIGQKWEVTIGAAKRVDRRGHCVLSNG